MYVGVGGLGGISPLFWLPNWAVCLLGSVCICPFLSLDVSGRVWTCLDVPGSVCRSDRGSGRSGGCSLSGSAEGFMMSCLVVSAFVHFRANESRAARREHSMGHRVVTECSEGSRGYIFYFWDRSQTDGQSE